ncbi:MAG: hypothetical protein IIB06_10295 [Bacteroidetes bacterium]|nr:hypothetical protein [Bacteroidota bacterium]
MKQKSATLKLAKEYGFANAPRQRKKCQCTTMYKNNSGFGAKTKVVPLYKV